ncbi:hypothetical protein I350_00248 [Cryptococcus amylolentus CBS 6273]|uniref:Zinc finger PHD-type domain-containing protein n=1 Tax=Cryptococcus amylolentus CBS 6273 TaxID=1296118 RepID=A0A1E3KEE8_9TREE|nr:hypothetical protein I350_00248 [Cryptococcus amylolentus CBS 6273]
MPPAPSDRFILLPSTYLPSRDPTSTVTLQSLIDVSDRIQDDARETLPFKFDECSYNCGGKGVCYGCSISCHGDHKLVELWTKRFFRCDCPTTSMQPEPLAGNQVKRRRCTLNPPEIQPQSPNHKNKYTHNFKGEFCRCGRDYDAETEEEAMLSCLGCEDWFHESCLNLRLPASITSEANTEQLPTPVTASSQPLGEPVPAFSAPSVDAQAAEEEDDDDERVLIPSDTYDSLICSACVRSNPFMKSQAGKGGWMMIEPSSSGSWEVIGKSATGSDSQIVDEMKNGKRALQENEADAHAKKIKLDDATVQASSGEETSDWKWQGKGDVFLSHGIREKLKTQLDESTIASLPFPLEDGDIYEPARDEQEDQTTEEVMTRALSNLPRVQTIEALHGYQRLKNRLSEMLAERAADGRSVSKEDIDEMFEQLRSGQQV